MANQARELLNRLRGQRRDPDVPIVDAQGNVAPPPGPTAAQMLLKRFRGTQPAGTTPQAITAGIGERMMGNVAGLPQGLLNLSNQAFANPVRGLLGQPERPTTDLGLPTGREMASGVESAGMFGRSLLPGGGEFEGLPQAFEQRMDFRNQMEQDRPGATQVGQFLGDVGTLATGRAPFVRGPGGVFDAKIASGLENAAKAVNPSNLSTGGRAAMQQVIKSDAFKTFSRAGGRAAETGIEGAMLAVMQDGDPIATAGLAAGGQLAASGALGMAAGAVGIPGELVARRADDYVPKSLKGKAFAAVAGATVMGGLILLAKQATPGGDDYTLPSNEAGFAKYAASFLLGATAGLAGKRTKAGGILETLPRMGDTILTIPRTGMIKLAQAAAEDPEMERAVVSITANPTGFTRNELERFRETMDQDDPAAALRDLMNDEDFRQKLSAPDPRLIGVPVKEDE